MALKGRNIFGRPKSSTVQEEAGEYDGLRSSSYETLLGDNTDFCDYMFGLWEVNAAPLIGGVSVYFASFRLALSDIGLQQNTAPLGQQWWTIYRNHAIKL